MLINGNTKIYNISAKISEQEINNIKYYIKGAVYSYSNNRKDGDAGSEWFAAYNLFGEDNYYWSSPLISIYDCHKSMGKDDDTAREQSGKDIGWLLKKVLLDDTSRNYEQDNTQRKYEVKTYRWRK